VFSSIIFVEKLVHGGSFNAKCTFKAKLRIDG